jgi:glutamate dehydrogenase/leucine dehydrogenase
VHVNRGYRVQMNSAIGPYKGGLRYDTPGNYANGANIAGFLKVANSMMDQGLV